MLQHKTILQAFNFQFFIKYKNKTIDINND